MFGGETVEYKLDGERDWSIDLVDLKSKMNDRVKLLVLINPNNPTGNVLKESEIVEILNIVSDIVLHIIGLSCLAANASAFLKLLSASLKDSSTC